MTEPRRKSFSSKRCETDIALVNDMARFYLYDIARQIGPARRMGRQPPTGCASRKDLRPARGTRETILFSSRLAALSPGFCLIDRYALVPDIDWNMSQFFVMGPWARTRGGPKGDSRSLRPLPGPLAGDAGAGEHGRHPVLEASHRRVDGRDLRGTAAPGAGTRQRLPQRDDLHLTRITGALKSTGSQSQAAITGRSGIAVRPIQRSAKKPVRRRHGDSCCSADPDQLTNL